MLCALPSLQKLSVDGNNNFQTFVVNNAAQLQHLTHLQLDLGSSSSQLTAMEKPGGIQSFIGAVRSLPRLCTCQSMRCLELRRLQTTADFGALKALRQLQRLKLDVCAARFKLV